MQTQQPIIYGGTGTVTNTYPSKRLFAYEVKEQPQGSNKTRTRVDLYKDGRLFASIPPNAPKPLKRGTKTIKLNNYKYQLIWK